MLAGAALGCGRERLHHTDFSCTHLREHAHYEALLFDIVRLDRLFILENLA